MQNSNRFLKIAITVFCLVLGVFLGASTLFFVRMERYDTRLWKQYLSVNKMNSDEVVTLAKKDCLKVTASKRWENAPADYFDYTKSLNQKMLTAMGMTVEGARGMLFVYREVPETNKCWLIWAIDLKGRGMVGYENEMGKMQLFSSSLPKDQLETILKDIKILL